MTLSSHKAVPLTDKLSVSIHSITKNLFHVKFNLQLLEAVSSFSVKNSQ